jgi:hypothetical protein
MPKIPPALLPPLLLFTPMVKNTAAADEGGSVKNEIELSNEADADLAKDLKDASIEEKA